MRKHKKESSPNSICREHYQPPALEEWLKRREVQPGVWEYHGLCTGDRAAAEKFYTHFIASNYPPAPNPDK